MYQLLKPLLDNPLPAALSAAKPTTTKLWHRRLAHLSPQILTFIHIHVDDVPQLDKMKENCRACRLGKAHRFSFHSQFEHAISVGGILHSDIVGKVEPSYPDRLQYISTFLYDHSRYTLIGFMKHRSNISDVFKAVTARFREVGVALVKKLHTDSAREYIALQNFLEGGDINKSISPPYIPELNGIAERVNRIMVEATLLMLIQADLPPSLRPYAEKHATYVCS